MHDPSAESPAMAAVAALEPPRPTGAEQRPEPPSRDWSVALDRGDVSAPASWRQFLVVSTLALVADGLIYRGSGFSGWGAFCVLAPILLLAASWRTRPSRGIWVIGGMLLLLALRLAWLGSGVHAFVGLILLVAFSLTVRGHVPTIKNTLVQASQAFVVGGGSLMEFLPLFARARLSVPLRWISAVGLPAVAVMAFGTIFVKANPDLAQAFGRNFQRFVAHLQQFFGNLAPDPLELIFLAVVVWLAAGLIRPMTEPAKRSESDVVPPAGEPRETPHYAALRNMFVALIGLFAAYLVFEFRTLWFREFPKGFHYSGYAHEGAAWLTAALALATVMLSIVFQAEVRRDPRCRVLRRLTWIWSAENLLLALAVYHRLGIYVGFNGMTRMRVVGFLGMSAVVVGFLLVVMKVAKGFRFGWLVQRQLWTLAFFVFLFVLLPVDALVHSYNVRRILAGDPAPAVQISTHPIDASGLLVLPPLLDANDDIIREGIRALLAQEDARREEEPRLTGWTGFQLANQLLSTRLEESRPWWQGYRTDEAARRDALTAFHKYVYQWY